MRADITDPDEIRMLLEYAALAGPPSLFTASGKGAPMPAAVARLDGDGFGLRLDGPPEAREGEVLLRVASLQYRFATRLGAADEGPAPFALPRQLLVRDARRCVRLRIPAGESKLVRYGDVGGRQMRTGLILDVSAIGMALSVAEPSALPLRSTPVRLQFAVLGSHLLAEGEVVETRGNLARIHFTRMDRDLQTEFNRKISEQARAQFLAHLSELRAGEQSRSRIQKAEPAATPQRASRLVAEFVNPILEAALFVSNSFLGISPRKREVSLERVGRALYDLTAEISFRGDGFCGGIFLCFQEATLLRVAAKALGRPAEVIDPDVRDLVGELANMIIGNSKRNLPEGRQFQLTTPTVVQGKEHVVAVFSQHTVIRISFDSELGPFDISVFLDEVHRQAAAPGATEQSSLPFVYDANVIDPLLLATEQIIGSFLGVECRKKGVEMKNALAPKYGLSANINVFTPGVSGKIFVNLSDRLALGIYRALLGEEKEAVDEEVHDAVAELVNMIAGNAKRAYAELGLDYKLSIPYVVQGREQTISSAGSAPFITSTYWTEQGFFEVCLSFTRIVQAGD